MHFLCTKAVEQIAHYESRFILIADMEVKMDKLYWGAVVIFAIGWYIEQRMYVDGYTRRKRDPYKPIDYLMSTEQKKGHVISRNSAVSAV